MLSDEEMLDRIRPRAAQIQRRDRLRVTSAAVLLVVALLGGAVTLLTDDSSDAAENVLTDGDRRSTTTADAASTTEVDRTTTDDPGTTQPPSSTTTRPAATTTDGTTSTAPEGTAPEGTAPAGSTTTTTAPPSSATTPLPPKTARDSTTVDGLTLEVTVTYPSQTLPGPATATVRLTSARASRPGVVIVFEANVRGTPSQSGGSQVDPDCIDGPSTGPDQQAGPVDQTFTFSYVYEPSNPPYTGPARTVQVGAWVSLCTDEQATALLEIPVTLP